MREWAKRALGVLAGAVGLWTMTERIIGLPGYISDFDTWLGWLGWAVISSGTELLLGFGLLCGGTLLATSSWWWRTMATTIDVDPDVAQFETLLLLIERLTKARKPALMGAANMSVARWRMAEDQIEMTAQLDALSIPYPPADASNADWYRYLISLARLSKAGKLEEARKRD